VETAGQLAINGLNHAKRLFDLTEGLLARGYTEAEVKLILGENAVRVLGQIWPSRNQS
jgi:membrane dipeptidase